MPLLELRSVSINYELSGAAGAPVLMLSNSLGTTLEMWDSQLQMFGRHFQILRYDMRGHGKSSTPDGSYSISQLGDDIIDLLDALNMAKVHFCGLSIGGVLGQWLGINAPSRLNRLVLCNTAAKIGSPETWNGRIELVQRSGMEAIADAVIARWFSEQFLASGSPAIEAMRKMLCAADPIGYVATCAAIRDMDQRNEIAHIITPTMVVAGEYDTVTTVADAKFLEHSIRGAQFLLLPAAHISNVQAHQHFNAAVCKFLTQGGVQ